MPRRDGTGPNSKGRRKGKGRGDGNGFSLYNKQGKFSIWRSLVIPAIGFIINDLRKRDGVTRQAIHSIANHLKNKKLDDNKGKEEVKTAEYEVVEDDKKGE